MKLLPYYSFSHRLPYNKQQAVARVFENTEANSFGKTHSKTKTFIGILTESSFKIKKSLKQKKSFMPVAIGQLSDDGYYCQLAVIMRPALFTLVFMFIWFAFFINSSIGFYKATSTISLLYLGLIIFGYLLMNFAFWHEVSETEKAINHVFGVNEVAD